MTKVLGVKLDDETYSRFADLPGSISDNLKVAIQNHLNNKVNHVNSVVNHSNYDYECINLARRLVRLWMSFK
jgi:hypothetical protein